MKTGFCTIGLKDRPFEEALGVAARSGFDGVELWGREPHMGELFDEKRVQAVRASVEERGLSPLVFGSYVGSLREGIETDLKRGREAVRIARGFGSPIMRVWAGSAGLTVANSGHRRDVISFFKALCDEAEGAGLLLAIERHRDTLADGSESLLDLIDSVGSPALRVNYQMTFLPDEDYLADIRSLGELVVNMHCHDARAPWAAYEERESRPLGEGYVDFPGMVEVLREIGFGGALEVERPAGGVPEESLRRDSEFLRGLVARDGRIEGVGKKEET